MAWELNSVHLSQQTLHPQACNESVNVEILDYCIIKPLLISD